MSDLSANDLQGWLDPDDLLKALFQLSQSASGGQQVEIREAIAALIEHEDADVRQEALRLLLIAWKLGSYRDKAAAVLRTDPEGEVRATAAFGVAALSTFSSRLDNVALLLEILLDREQPTSVRGAAYEALLIIHRRPRFPPISRGFIPTEDVDWKWVDQLQTEIRLSH